MRKTPDSQNDLGGTYTSHEHRAHHEKQQLSTGTAYLCVRIVVKGNKGAKFMREGMPEGRA